MGGARNPAYWRALWIALGVNLTMFVVEMVAGLSARSVFLQADSLAFLGDTANYGISNMRSAWLCSRNDLIGNCAVLASAFGVARMGAAWPDVLVAAIMAVLALQAAAVVVTHAHGELAGAAR
jgi:Co/Zn/Cd efflux system component